LLFIDDFIGVVLGFGGGVVGIEKDESIAATAGCVGTCIEINSVGLIQHHFLRLLELIAKM